METADEQSIAIEQAPSSAPAFRVHPFADQFPMMDADELDALAEDIDLNGLRTPIVQDRDGMIIDGRNRLRACELADVEPTFTTFDGDPIAYIVSANVTRRHLSKGQAAMAYAMAYPDATAKGGRGKTTVSNTAVSSEYITKARFVLRHAPDLASKVMGGSSLPDAYTLASEQKREREEYEQTRNDVRERLDAIVAVCMQMKSHIERPSFLDQADFVRQVQTDAKTIGEHVAYLSKDL